MHPKTFLTSAGRALVLLLATTQPAASSSSAAGPQSQHGGARGRTATATPNEQQSWTSIAHNEFEQAGAGNSHGRAATTAPSKQLTQAGADAHVGEPHGATHQGPRGRTATATRASEQQPWTRVAHNEFEQAPRGQTRRAVDVDAGTSPAAPFAGSALFLAAFGLACITVALMFCGNKADGTPYCSVGCAGCAENPGTCFCCCASRQDVYGDEDEISCFEQTCCTGGMTMMT